MRALLHVSAPAAVLGGAAGGGGGVAGAGGGSPPAGGGGGGEPARWGERWRDHAGDGLAAARVSRERGGERGRAYVDAVSHHVLTGACGMQSVAGVVSRRELVGVGRVLNRGGEIEQWVVERRAA